MNSPIAKLMSSLESLDEDLKNAQKKDADARLAVEKIEAQMEEWRAEVDSNITNLKFFLEPSNKLYMHLQFY